MGKRKLAVPVAKGQTYTVPIHGMGSNGEGIGRVEGFTVFVPFALPGETVGCHPRRMANLAGKTGLADTAPFRESSLLRRWWLLITV